MFNEMQLFLTRQRSGNNLFTVSVSYLSKFLAPKSCYCRNIQTFKIRFSLLYTSFFLNIQFKDTNRENAPSNETQTLTEI